MIDCSQVNTRVTSCSSEYSDACMYDVTADVEMECLAAWKIGSKSYAFGRFIGPGFTVKRDAYRCLVSYVLHGHCGSIAAIWPRPTVQ